MSDPVLGTTGAPGAGETEPTLADPERPVDRAAIREESMQTVTNDAVAGETVDPGIGEGNFGSTGGSPREAQPELPDNELVGQDIDLDDAPRSE